MYSLGKKKITIHISLDYYIQYLVITLLKLLFHVLKVTFNTSICSFVKNVGGFLVKVFVLTDQCVDHRAGTVECFVMNHTVLKHQEV